MSNYIRGMEDAEADLQRDALSREVVRKVEVAGYGNITLRRDTPASSVVEITVEDTESDSDAQKVTVELWAEELSKLDQAIGEVRFVQEPDTQEYQPIDIEVSPFTPERVSDPEAVVQQYVDAKTAMLIDYTDFSGERSSRVVSPLEVRTIQESSFFTPPKYLIAWDHEKEAYRNFRIARINALCPSIASFKDPEA
jgi:predicted DNA-binding transcriptional regulator YafY